MCIAYIMYNKKLVKPKIGSKVMSENYKSPDLNYFF